MQKERELAERRANDAREVKRIAKRKIEVSYVGTHGRLFGGPATCDVAQREALSF